ncbi:MAG: EF hand [candidate division BRC1 bacterium ADurb.BinA364]|nr:MAG: EF hand [candidate division BRC1 bacterium ADurb.BinA364]
MIGNHCKSQRFIAAASLPHRTWAIALGAMAFASAIAVWSQEPSAVEARLQALYERYPQADADGDGTLTPAEARDYQQKMRGQQALPAEQDIKEQEPTSENRPNLADALKRYPQSDKDGDGILTQEEFREFLPLKRMLEEDRINQTKSDRGRAVLGIPIPPTHTNVQYGPENQQVMNLWIVPASRPTPMIICLKGGVSFASIQYPFQSKDRPLPIVLRDIARALQFLRYEAQKYNIEKTQFAAYGFSAGGNASAWLLLRDDLADPQNPDPVLRESSRLQAAAPFDVQMSMDIFEWHKHNSAFEDKHLKQYLMAWGYDPDMDPESEEILKSRQEVQSWRWISKDDGPICILSPAEADNLPHNPQSTYLFYEACLEAGMHAELYSAVYGTWEKRPDYIEWMIQRLNQN